MKLSNLKKLLCLSSLILIIGCSPKNGEKNINNPIIANPESRDSIIIHNSSKNHEKNQAQIDSLKNSNAGKNKGGI